MYKLLRSLLFCFPAEAVHYFSMNMLRRICSIGWMRKWLINKFVPIAQPAEWLGLRLRNRIGLGAGFDKNALYLSELECLGFGFVEIGTVTPQPQEGNPKPRLFRLKNDQALINRMGFNNEGKDAIAERLGRWRLTNKNTPLIIGGNIGKNKSTPNEYAYMDYDACFRALHPHVDYFVVNVSSPNTPGLRELQDKEALRQILVHLQGINAGYEIQRPILLKIAPDLSDEQVKDVASLAMEIKLDGLVATNTTLDRSMLSDAGKIRSGEAGAGGLSGKPLRQRAQQVLQMLVALTGGKIPIIASGGIFTPADSAAAFQAGASLVQVWTGFVYEGPGIVKRLATHAG
jgi:dihydroorotate dehydrogenase